MPGNRHVFDPLFAGVFYQRKSQRVFVRSAKLIGAGAFAAFGSFPARFLDGDRVTCDCVITPDMAGRINDIECPVGLDRPDGAKRIGPCAHQRSRRAGRIRRACIQEQEKNASEKCSECDLCFHAVDRVRSPPKVKLGLPRR